MKGLTIMLLVATVLSIAPAVRSQGRKSFKPTFEPPLLSLGVAGPASMVVTQSGGRFTDAITPSQVIVGLEAYVQVRRHTDRRSIIGGPPSPLVLPTSTPMIEMTTKSEQQVPLLRCFFLSSEMLSSPRDASIERSSDVSATAACEIEAVASLGCATTLPLTGIRVMDGWMEAIAFVGAINLLSHPFVVRGTLRTEETSSSITPLTGIR